MTTSMTRPRPWRRRTALVLGALALTVAGQCAAGSSASAHPLGNLSVNQYHGLTVRPDRVDDFAVVDLAEIPTLQERDRIDADRAGGTSPTELAAYADRTCASVAADLRITVDDRASSFRVTASRAEQPRGSGGLATTRIECELTAPVDLTTEARLRVASAHLVDRVGWREFTAVGAGVALPDDGTPRVSPSAQLRSYPTDLLTSPLNVRAVDVWTRPGADAAPRAKDAAAPSGPLPDFVEDAHGAVQRAFDNLVGADRITPVAGIAAVMLALLLGASHAVLPGHGKTVMAAYLALRGADGRRQGVRDAVTVGATVTLTHTAGVLVLGLLLTGSASLAGDSVIAYLGAASGVLVVAVGASLLRSALRGENLVHGHAHSHDHHHAHPHTHDHARTHSHERVPATTGAPPQADTEHAAQPGAGEHRATHHHHAHTPAHTHTLTDDHRPRRRVLVGMGIAGGLVPSPSALVVLLGAIALGRTAFGVLLVLAYGLGMAAVLIAAGLLLVRVRERARKRLPKTTTRLARLIRPTLRRAPALTALFVVAVGLVLAWRGLSSPSAFG
ncbi:nickel/cobalt transporter [Yinghuangia sp. YIM S09857]|uniref:nickel/cobalt transporter n=1 Tax=Yinghuangia sp. YIM S09857 TaxID=3436929 RepID=UPI003F535EF7